MTHSKRDRKERRTDGQNRRPLDRKTLVINLFREHPNNRFSLKTLASLTGGASKEGRRETGAAVEALCAEGLVEPIGREKYRLSPSHLPRHRGRAEMTSKGTLFVQIPGWEQEIRIGTERTNHALNGDLVEAVVTRTGRDGTPEGEVVRIVERSRKPYVGIAEVGPHQILVHCNPRRIPVDICLPRQSAPGVRDGEKVSVRIADWTPGSRCPMGELLEILGEAGANETEMHAILAEYDLPYRFEPEVERAAAAIDGRITEQDYAERRDFRAVTTFTVDPADAKDFDDALSIRRVKEGVWEVGVHIADVTHYVRPHSIIDREAEARGTSVYLVDRTVPMLPERLSNELCSLRPHEESLCFSAVFTLNEQLDILDEWFGRTVIHSDRRFTYAEAQEVIETGRGDFAGEIAVLNRLAQALRQERFRHGAIAFEREEVRFVLDAEGRPLGVTLKEQKEANMMIEEFMLLANRRVAEFCARRRTPKGRAVPRTMVFRVHDAPNEEKLERFRSFVLRFGHVFKAAKGRAVAREMNRLMAEVKGSAEANAVSTLAVRAMAKACYTTDNIGHYGLAFPYYTHFTSPIRRYPDMMVHRLLARYLEGGKSADRESLEAICTHASEREIIAAEAERASVKYKMVEYMKEHLGEEFAGHVSGLSERGVFVELEGNHIEGMAPMRDIVGDFFRFDEQSYEVIGLRTGRRMTLGDAVRVRVKRTDLMKRQLDFVLLPPDGDEETVEEKNSRIRAAEQAARGRRSDRKPYGRGRKRR